VVEGGGGGRRCQLAHGVTLVAPAAEQAVIGAEAAVVEAAVEAAFVAVVAQALGLGKQRTQRTP